MLQSRLLCLCFLSYAVADDLIILPPQKSDPSLPQKLMVFIPGGLVPNNNYTQTAIAIQKSSNLRLWVAIPAILHPAPRLCISMCPSPKACFPLHSTVQDSLKAAAKAGFQGNAPADMFLAGHSLGGTCANYLLQGYATSGSSPEFAGLILMGGYVDESGPGGLAQYPVPVLTVGAELDGGLARPGKMSLWFQQFQDMLQANRTAAMMSKPVVVLPGIDHSNFCPGFAVKGDLPSEVDSAAALNLIGPVIAAFLHLHTAQPAATHTAALATLNTAVEGTTEMLSGMLSALRLEVQGGFGILNQGVSSPWCSVAQGMLAGLSGADAAKLSVSNTYFQRSFEHSRCTYSTTHGRLRINTTGHNKYYWDIQNTGNWVCGSEIGCKMASADRVEQQLNVSVSKKVTCMDVNKHAIEVAESLVSNRTLQRYKQQGRPICLLPDYAALGNIGPLWVKGTMTIKDNTTCLTVASLMEYSSLDDPILPESLRGAHYCKLISPARVVDWMMTDSLQKS